MVSYSGVWARIPIKNVRMIKNDLKSIHTYYTGNFGDFKGNLLIRDELINNLQIEIVLEMTIEQTDRPVILPFLKEFEQQITYFNISGEATCDANNR
jgi:hypothetical protein